MKRRQLLIVAPHFEHPGHLGGIRTERFQRWAGEEGFEVIVVRAASTERIEERPWGRVITIRDPLGFYRDVSGDNGERPPAPRNANRLRQTMAYLLWVPDPVMLWASRVLRSAALREFCPRPDWILASSPPESSLVLAFRLAERGASNLFLDFRDGWLDETMIPLLKTSAFQRRRHARLESMVIRRAQAITLSSEIWHEMLGSRYPEEAGKMAVLTNCCPPEFPSQKRVATDGSGRLKLLYAGKIHSSRPERRIEMLLDPLETGLPAGGELIFRGNLSQTEIRELESRAGRFARIDWKLSVLPPIRREGLWKEIREADGLLMLSNSRASIPAKLYDYLPSGRPILAMTGRDSILDRLANKIPQLFLYHDENEQSRIQGFVQACRSGSQARIPEEFREARLQRTFLELLSKKLS